MKFKVGDRVRLDKRKVYNIIKNESRGVKEWFEKIKNETFRIIKINNKSKYPFKLSIKTKIGFRIFKIDEIKPAIPYKRVIKGLLK